MNIIKRFLGKANTDDLVTLPKGQLALFRNPSSPKSESECLYNDAVATIRATSKQFHYQLLIRRAYEEGEDELKGDEDTDDSLLEEQEGGDVRNFLISQDLKVYKSMNDDGNNLIVWKDDSGDEGDNFMFTCDGDVPDALVDLFMEVVWKCAYELKYKKLSLNASQSDLDEFKHDTLKVGESLFVEDDFSSFEDSVTTEDEDDVEDFQQELTLKRKPVYKSKIKVDKKTPAGIIVATDSCELRFFDPTDNEFMVICLSAYYEIIDEGKYKYSLTVKDEDTDKLYVSTSIDEELMPSFDFDILSFLFNSTEVDTVSLYLLKFDNFSSLDVLQKNVAKYRYSAINKKQWTQVPNEDQSYIVNAISDLNITKKKYQTESETESDSESESDDGEFQDANEVFRKRNKTLKKNVHDEEDDTEATKFKTLSKNSAFKSVAVSHNTDLTFAQRGSNIGVFKSDQDEEVMKFHLAITNIINNKGKKLNPTKMMLHLKETSMILNDTLHPDKLMELDLVKGKIVNELNLSNAGVGVKIKDFTPLTKNSYNSAGSTFSGVSSNALFQIDTRLSNNNIVESQFKQYSGNPKFTVLATTEEGYLTAGTESGDIELYNKYATRAKTALPGLGDEILHIDIKGDWILLTTKAYLLLIESKIKDGKNKGKSAFTASFSKDDKPTPIMLSLLRDHEIQLRTVTKSPIVFTPAKFDMGEDKKIDSIVTSSGPFVIRWSFKQIMKGDRFAKYVSRMESDVVANQYKLGDLNNTIVATTDDIKLFNKRRFKKPSRKSG